MSALARPKAGRAVGVKDAGKLLGASLVCGTFVSAVFGGISALILALFFWAGEVDKSHTHTDKALRQAAASVIVARGTHGFPSRAALESAIETADPKLAVLTGSPTDYYHQLKHNGGSKDGTVYVQQATSGQVELVARAGHGAIDSLTVHRRDDGVSPSPAYHTLYGRAFNGVDYDWTIAAIGGFFFLIGGVVGFAEELDGEESIRAKRRWQALTKDGRFGPRAIEDGFTLFEPVCKDEGDEVQLSVRRLRWSKTKKIWQVDDSCVTDIAGLEPQSIPHERGVEAASDAWFDLCRRVAEANAASWSKERARREAEAAAKRQQAQLDAARKSLAAGKEVDLTELDGDLEELETLARRQRNRIAPLLTPAQILIDESDIGVDNRIATKTGGNV